MTGTKTSDQKPPKVRSRTRTTAQEQPIVASRKKGFWREFFISLVAHSIAPLALAAASAAWLYFAQDRNGSVPRWPFLVFVVLTIVFTYLSLVSLQFFFNEDFVLARRPSLHLALLAILVVTVTAPLALTLSFTTARTNELKAQIDKLEGADSRLIHVYKNVNESMMNVLHKQNIDTGDFQDIFNSCIQSISLAKPQIYEFRATVVYLDETGRYLVVPQKGYYGVGFDKTMQDLYLEVSPEIAGKGDDDSLKRIGIAGRSYLIKQPIKDDDVQIPTPGKGYIYKPFEGSSEDLPDRAMICVPIPNLTKEGKPDYVGVLSISSPTASLFTDNDVAVARFYATLLGKFKTPVATPQFSREAEQKTHGN